MKFGNMQNFLKSIIFSLSLIPFLGMLTACGSSCNQEATAKCVRDKASLKDFVLAAKGHLEDDYEQAIVDFRQKNSRWRYGSVYIFIVDDKGKTQFHAEYPVFEGNAVHLTKDKYGASIADRVTEVGMQPGGGFLRYKFDDPEIERKDSSNKIGYAISFDSPHHREQKYIVGSGFYLE